MRVSDHYARATSRAPRGSLQLAAGSTEGERFLNKTDGGRWRKEAISGKKSQK